MHDNRLGRRSLFYDYDRRRRRSLFYNYDRRRRGSSFYDYDRRRRGSSFYDYDRRRRRGRSNHITLLWRKKYIIKVTEENIYSPNDFSELRLNRFAYPSSSEGNGQTLTLVTVILFITTVSAVFQIFFTQMKKRLRRIVLMKSIGAESRQIAKMLFWEFFYFWITTLPVGSVLGLGGAYITTSFLEKAQNRDIIYTVDPLIFIFAILAGTFALFIGMMIPSIMAIGVPLT
jgi:ABC-type antimicrobial peptide transport system permease subunit